MSSVPPQATSKLTGGHHGLLQLFTLGLEHRRHFRSGGSSSLLLVGSPARCPLQTRRRPRGLKLGGSPQPPHPLGQGDAVPGRGAGRGILCHPSWPWGRATRGPRGLGPHGPPSPPEPLPHGNIVLRRTYKCQSMCQDHGLGGNKVIQKRTLTLPEKLGQPPRASYHEQKNQQDAGASVVLGKTRMSQQLRGGCRSGRGIIQ